MTTTTPPPQPPEEVLEALNAAGYPFPQTPQQPPSVEDVLSAAFKALQYPSARMLEAAAVALLYVAHRTTLQAPPEALPVAALQRAGYAADSLSLLVGLPPGLRDRLEAFCGEVADRLPPHSSLAPVPWNEGMPPGRLKRLLEEADPTSKRWQVYGNAVPRRALYALYLA